MDNNPNYQPALAPQGNPQQPASIPTQPFQQQQHQVAYDSNPFVATAKGLGSILSKNSIPALLTQLIPFILGFALAIVDITTQLIGVPTAIRVILLLAIGIAAVITSLKATAASIVIYRRSVEGHEISTKEAMAAYPVSRIVVLLLTSLLAGLFVVIGLILFIIPGLIVLARVSLLPFTVFEENLSGFAAIKRSWSLTKGHTFEMWGALIAQGILSGGGLLAVPAYTSAIGSRYTQLKAAKDSNASTGRMHFMNWLLAGIVLLFVILYFAFIVLVIYAARNTLDDARIDLDTRSNSYQDQFDSNNFSDQSTEVPYCYYPSDGSTGQKCADNLSECYEEADCIRYWNL